MSTGRFRAAADTVLGMLDPPASGAAFAAARGPVGLTQFPDGTLALVAHGSALHLKPEDARFVARVLQAMYLVDADDGK